MEIYFTSDTSNLSRVSELTSEMEDLLEPLKSKYSRFELNIYIAFRCIPESIGRKSSIRYEKQEKNLLIDITVSEDLYKLMSIQEQREHLGNVFLYYLITSFSKYKRNLNIADSEAFLNDIAILLKKHSWVEGPIAKAKEMIGYKESLDKVCEVTSIPFDELVDFTLEDKKKVWEHYSN